MVPDAATDTDGDGLPNVEEVDTYGLNTTNPDTDDDGLSDGYEVTMSHTDPAPLSSVVTKLQI